MSLLVDSIFIKALQSNAAIKKAVGAKIYGTTIKVPDKDLKNTKPPYIVVSFDGFSNATEGKDDDFESDEDQVNVSIVVVAGTLAALHTLMEAVRRCIRDACRDVTEDDPRYDDYPLQYNVSGGKIEYDAEKDAYWTAFSYECAVSNN